MASRLSTGLRFFAALITLVLVAFFTGLLPLNLGFLKDAIATAVHERTGLELSIEGSLRAKLGPRPFVEASGLVLGPSANAASPLLEVGRLAVRPRLLDILRGRLHFRGIRLEDVTLDYCPSQWPDRPGDGSSEPLSLAIDSLTAERLMLRCEQPERVLGFLPESLEVIASAAEVQPVSLEVKGRHSGESMRLWLEGDSLSTLLASPEAYRFRGRLQALSAELVAEGHLERPLAEPEVEAFVRLTAPEPAVTLGHFGIETRPLGALQFSGRLQAGGDTVSFQQVSGDLAGNRFTASGSVTGPFDRPTFELNGAIDELSIAPPAESGDLPAGSDAMDFGGLLRIIDGLNGHLTLRAGRILGLPLTLTELALEAQVGNGLMRVSDAQLLFASGSLAASASLDVRQPCPAMQLQAKVVDLDLSLLARPGGPGADLEGWIDRSAIQAATCGRKFEALLSALHFEALVEGARARVGGLASPLTIHRVDAAAAWQDSGRIELRGEFLDEPLRVKARFGGIGAILAGETTDLDLSAQAANAALAFEGRGSHDDSGLALQGAFRFEAARLGALHRWLGVDPANDLALDYSSGVRLAPGALQLDGIEARLGGSNLGGSLHWVGNEPMAVTLESQHIDLDELAGVTPPTAQAATGSASAADASKPGPLLGEEMDAAGIDLELRVARVTRGEYAFEGVELLAHLRNRLVRAGRLKTNVGERAATLSFDMDFRSEPYTLAALADLENINVQDLLAGLGVATVINASAQRIHLDYRSSGDTPRELLENSNLRGHIESADWWFDTGPAGNRHHLAIEDLAIETAAGAAWAWRGTGRLNEVPLALWVLSPPLAAAFDRQQPLPLTAVLESNGDIARVEAEVKERSEDGYRAELRIQGAYDQTPSIDLASPELRLDDYQLQSTLRVSSSAFHLSPVDLRMGASRISGDALIRYQPPGYFVQADLASPFLETDDLVRSVDKWRDAYSRDGPEGPPGENGSADGGIIELLNGELDAVLANHRLDVGFDIQELHSGGIELGPAHFAAQSGDDGLQADLRIGSPGEEIAATYQSGGLSGPGVAFSAQAERFEYGGMSRLFFPESELSGELYLDTSLTSHSSDANDLLRQLEGHLDLAVFPRNVAADALDLWASNLVLALLRAGAESSKQMNCGVARFDVKDGVMKSRNTFLDTTDIIVRARGQIDLADNEINLWVAPQAKVERFLSVSTPLRVTGPLNDFSVGMPASGFLTTMIRWYYGLIYVPWKWLTGERFPANGVATCYRAMDWEYTGEHDGRQAQ